MTALETLAWVGAVAFIVEVAILLCLGRDDSDAMADLAAWKASFHERQCQRLRRRKRGARREGSGVTYRHVG